jgi:hypothetical protein
MRGGNAIQSVTLRKLPEFQREDELFSEVFSTLTVTRACGSGSSIYFITMQYMGDMTSPAFVFTLVPSEAVIKFSFSFPNDSGFYFFQRHVLPAGGPCTAQLRRIERSSLPVAAFSRLGSA